MTDEIENFPSADDPGWRELAIQSAIDQWYSIEGGPKDMPGEPSLAHWIEVKLREAHV